MATKINDNPIEASEASSSSLRSRSLTSKAEPRKVDISAGADAEDRLRAIMDGLAETVLTMSDAEVLEEVRLQGRDPVREAEETRKVLTDALKGVARKVDRPHQPS
jgi:hypothetical protein